MGPELEAYGRIGSGVVELIALLSSCSYQARCGSEHCFALGDDHRGDHDYLTMLGIVVKDDGGLLFILAVTVFVLKADHLLDPSPRHSCTRQRFAKL